VAAKSAGSQASESVSPDARAGWKLAVIEDIIGPEIANFVGDQKAHIKQ
jgi:hypothetical protein